MNTANYGIIPRTFPTCLLLWCFSLFFCGMVTAQDIQYANQVGKTLASSKFYGRVYYKNGDQKAGKWIGAEMDKIGLEKPKGERFQEFTFPVVKFEKKVSLNINGNQLIPGKEFIVNAGSIPMNGKNFPSLFISAQCLSDSQCIEHAFNTKGFGGYVLILDTFPQKSKFRLLSYLRNLYASDPPYAEILLTHQQLSWSASTTFTCIPSFELKYHDQWKKDGLKISFNTGSEQVNEHTAYNVMGMVRGTKEPDSFLVITAHYDHLGQMGPKAMFPGANDNAAGIALMLDLARYYQKNPAAYSILFIAFAGEEAGLLGSEFYVKKPYHPLKFTRFLLNLDLVATGETGMTVVNGTVFQKEYTLLNHVNDSLQLLPAIYARGKARNSDHYPFTEKNIPSFFWYLSGERNVYHHVDDVWETIEFPKYDETFTLIREFFSKLQQ